MNAGDAARWDEIRRRVARLQSDLRRDVADACPGEHDPVQHRDRRRPWCRACGRTSDGVQVREL